MTREIEVDPEVLADLQLRESSTGDQSRTRKEPHWSPPTIGAQWPCRNPKCLSGAMVDIPVEAVEQLATFNGYLVARGERPIPTDAIAVCEPCKRLLEWHRTNTLIERTETMANLIRALKASGDPRRETEIVDQIIKLRHPDVEGLLLALEEKHASKSGKARKRAAL